MKKSTLDKYILEHPWSREILRMHFRGMSPSEIDEELSLRRGTAHDEIIAYWAFDKAALKGRLMV